MLARDQRRAPAGPGEAEPTRKLGQARDQGQQAVAGAAGEDCQHKRQGKQQGKQAQTNDREPQADVAQHQANVRGGAWWGQAGWYVPKAQRVKPQQ